MNSPKFRLVHELLRGPGAHLSFEFFPPKEDHGLEALYAIARELNVFKPDYFSVTWGAGGSTVRKSLEVASTIQQRTGSICVAHFTGLGMTRALVDEMIAEMKQKGIRNILVLRGDIPHGMKKGEAFQNGFRYAAELVAYIRSKPENSREDLSVLVAGCPEGHPEATSFESDMDYLAKKQEFNEKFN